MRRLMRLLQTIAIGLALSALGLLMHCDVVAAKSDRIMVLSGQDIQPYQEVLAGIQQSLTKQGIGASLEVHFLQGNTAKTQEALNDLKNSGLAWS